MSDERVTSISKVEEQEPTMTADGAAASTDSQLATSSHSQTDQQQSSSDANFIPSITRTQDVGPEGGRITVGACYIEFQSGTFTECKKVTVTARIDSSEWPEGEEVITPTLDVDVGKIHKPAKVRLSTWAFPDDGQFPLVQILHFSDNNWKIIHTQQLSFSRFIEFRCDNFSCLLARIVGLSSLPISFSMQPVLFVHRRTFVVVLHLLDEIMARFVSESMKREFKEEPDHTMQRSAMPFKFGERVEMSVECASPKEGFTFDPPEPFRRPINRHVISGNMARGRFIIQSKLPARSIIIYFNAGIEGTDIRPDAMEYYWISEEEEQQEYSSESSTS